MRSHWEQLFQRYQATNQRHILHITPNIANWCSAMTATRIGALKVYLTRYAASKFTDVFVLIHMLCAVCLRKSHGWRCFPVWESAEMIHRWLLQVRWSRVPLSHMLKRHSCHVSDSANVSRRCFLSLTPQVNNACGICWNWFERLSTHDDFHWSPYFRSTCSICCLFLCYAHCTYAS